MVYPVLLVVLLLLIQATALFGADPGVPATSPYDRHIIYQALVFFWIGIIGLIVIIVMKLREIRRVRNMDIDKEEKDAPFLD